MGICIKIDLKNANYTIYTIIKLKSTSKKQKMVNVNNILKINSYGDEIITTWTIKNYSNEIKCTCIGCFT
jgi:hypothetical protein